MKIQVFKGGYDRNFCYLITEKEHGILVDPFPNASLDEAVKNVKIDYIINTHTHFDHIQGNAVYKKEKTKIVAQKTGKGEKEISVKRRKSLTWMGCKITFLSTPGHSSCSMCVFLDKYVFTGDTLFVGSIGKFWSTEGQKELYESLQKIKKFDDTLIILPGHDYGKTPTSTIMREKQENRFLQMSKEDFMSL